LDVPPRMSRQRTPVIVTVYIGLGGHVFDARRGQFRAHPVPIEAQFAGPQGGPGRFFLGHSDLGAFDGQSDIGGGHAHDAVVVGQDHLARVDGLSADHDRYVHRARRRLDRALRADRGRPHREADGAQAGHVAHAEFALFRTLLRENPNFRVKVTCPDRLTVSGPPGYDDVIPFARALVEEFPDRVLWGTDWPHPNLRSHMPDDGVIVDLLPRIAPTEQARQLLVVDNPMRLYW
jgi:hypothetical protein